MATLVKAAKAVGVDRIMCPHCNNAITMRPVFRLLFQGIIKMLKSGSAVMIPSFGRFHITQLKGREHKTPIIPSGKMRFKDRKVMRFKQSRLASDSINQNPTEAQLKATKAAGEALAKKRAKKGAVK